MSTRNGHDYQDGRLVSFPKYNSKYIYLDCSADIRGSTETHGSVGFAIDTTPCGVEGEFLSLLFPFFLRTNIILLF